MIRAAANDFEGDATGATVANLQQSLGDQVVRVCQQVVTNRYPFVRGSDREVPLADFARLFAPGGIMDKFFAQNLAPYCLGATHNSDASCIPWGCRPNAWGTPNIFQFCDMCSGLQLLQNQTMPEGPSRIPLNGAKWNCRYRPIPSCRGLP